MFRRRSSFAIAMLAIATFSVSAEDVKFELVSHCSDCSAPSCSGGGDGCAADCCGKGGGCSGGCGVGACGGRLLGGCGRLGCGGCGLLNGHGLLGGGCGGGCGPLGGCGLLGSGCGGCCNGCGILGGLFGKDSGWDFGSWIQSGYHTEGNGLFNDHPDRYNLHQLWFYLEKVADGSDGLGLGGRVDLMYGVDAADTQAFGGTGWDTTWNRGAGYGWAMPQLYLEVATENSSTIIGHFFTLVGYEVVTAPDNFFYSHAMTMYNSEPFTHTGVLNTFNVSDNFTSYAGWTAGWDTGFERVNDGSSFLGGFSASLTDDVSLTYITTFGNFGDRSAGFNGYSHSIVLDTTLTEKLNYVFQSDLFRVQNTGEDNVGINQYLIYNLNDCLGIGTRMEWWKGDDITGYDYGGRSAAPVSSTSYYALTFGANIHVLERSVIRPEYRYNWSPGLDYDQGIFGVDWVTVF